MGVPLSLSLSLKKKIRYQKKNKNKVSNFSEKKENEEQKEIVHQRLIFNSTKNETEYILQHPSIFI